MRDEFLPVVFVSCLQVVVHHFLNLMFFFFNLVLGREKGQVQECDA